MRKAAVIIGIYLLLFAQNLYSDNFELQYIDIEALHHPYILFGAEDIPRLTERINQKPWQGIWENIVSAEAEDTDGVVNAFIYALTGDLERGLAAKDELQRLCRIEDWTDGMVPKLPVSERCRPAGLIYDMIYDLLSESEREEFSKKIVNDGILPLYNESFKAWWSIRRQHNYSPVFASGYGIAAMAVLKERPEAMEWIQRAYQRTRLFLNSQGTGGGYGEGVNYCNMSLRSIMPFADGLDRLFGIDLYQEKWLSQQAPDFLLYALSPDRRSTLNFNDAGINRIYDPHVMIRLAGRCRHKQAAWIVENDIMQGKGTLSFDWPGFGGKPGEREYMDYPSDIFSFLWLEPNAPQAALCEMERSKMFKSIGWTVFRSGWQEDDLQIGVISAPKFFGNHEQADRGSFIINAYGQRLISDSGKPEPYSDPLFFSWFKSSKAHNVMLVNGEGQTMLDELAGPGEMKDFFTTEKFDYVLTKNAKVYAETVKKWDRHFVFSVPEFVILLDDVELENESEIEFRFHSPSAKLIKIEENAALFPGDNAGTIPSIPLAQSEINEPMMQKYPDWWQTGKPMHELEPWDEQHRAAADLVLKSYSDFSYNARVEPGYQDYRFPSAFLANTYENILEGEFLSILYPRSAQMKKDQTLPLFKTLSPDIGRAVRVTREDRVWDISWSDCVEKNKLEVQDCLDVIGFWQFNSIFESGGNIYSPDDDSVVKSRDVNIRLANGANLVEPGFDGTGSALSLNGIDKFATIPWQMNDNINIQMAFKADYISDSENNYLVEVANIFRLYIDRNAKASMRIWDDENNSTGISLDYQTQQDQWYILEASYNPYGVVKLYLWQYQSGEFVDGYRSSFGSGNLRKTNNAHLILGSFRGGSQFFSGQIDRVRVANYSYDGKETNDKDYSAFNSITGMQGEKLIRQAKLSVVAAESGLLEGWIMIEGTKLAVIDVFEFIADTPVTAIGTCGEDYFKLECEVYNQSGGDLRIRLWKQPKTVEVNGEQVWAAVTDKHIEHHLPKGRSIVRINFE